jgi:hypothetical protein
MFEDKNVFFILLGVVACALVLVITVDLTSHESMIKRTTSGRAYTKELRRFRNLIQLGMPADQVEATFHQENFQHLLLTGGKGNVFEVSPPLTYGKNNWTLVIGTSNNVVVSVLVRKYGDRTTKPLGAPSDIAYPGYGGAS